MFERMFDQFGAHCLHVGQKQQAACLAECGTVSRHAENHMNIRQHAYTQNKDKPLCSMNLYR
jgi:hypothetical protein